MVKTVIIKTSWFSLASYMLLNIAGDYEHRVSSAVGELDYLC